MTSSAVPLVHAEPGNAAARDAAGIWARATARRDQLPVVPLPKDKLPGIESALGLDGALLLIARLDGKAMAFSVVIPRSDVLEVLYLAVDPTASGTGLARRLLDHLHEHSRSEKLLWNFGLSRTTVELSLPMRMLAGPRRRTLKFATLPAGRNAATSCRVREILLGVVYCLSRSDHSNRPHAVHGMRHRRRGDAIATARPLR